MMMMMIQSFGLSRKPPPQKKWLEGHTCVMARTVECFVDSLSFFLSCSCALVCVMARAINEVKKNRSTVFESKIWNEFKKSRCEMKKNRNRKKGASSSSSSTTANLNTQKD